MKNLRHCLSILVLSCCFSACTENRIRLHAALEFAGENRVELEEVLAYYRNDRDKRKLKAAKFLIANMPGHYSYEETPEMDSIKCILSDIYRKKPVDRERIEKWKKFPLSDMPKIYDSHVITAEYLIRNIDMAFEEYDGRPWNKGLSFRDFCELLLPYRTGNEPLEDWRTMYREHFRYIRDSIYTGADPVMLVNAVNNTIIDSLFKYNTDFSLPSLRPSYLMENRIGGCAESCDFTVFLLRSIGVPVATDFYTKDQPHSWNAVLDTTGRYEVFWFDRHSGNKAVRGASDGRLKGKVFRKCFAYNRDRSGISGWQKDVTDLYFGQNKAKVPVTGRKPDRNPSHGFFGKEGESAPLYPGKMSFGKAVFRDIEPMMAFVPTDDAGSPAGYPFFMDKSGNTVILKPDMNDTCTVRITRKTKLTDRMADFMAASEGAVIEGSSDPYFESPDTIAVCGCPRINYNYIYPDKTRRYRYIRFSTTKGREAHLGEMRIFRDTDRKDTVSLQVFSHSHAPDPMRQAEKAIDNDDLTFYFSNDAAPYIILDMGRKENIAVMEWVPRNDDNFIHNGDTYRLLYHDGHNGWQPVGGSKTACDTVLYFRNVPANALLRLHDITRGREESVFIISGGRQYFMS